MSQTYRIGVVGVGAIGEMHARAIGDLENADVIAGSCRTEEKGRQFAEEFDCEWYADYERLLDVEEPDAVTVCTPSGAHVEPTIAAAERGVHVLSEKPLEITTERIDRMTEAANEHGITLGGIFQQRFNPVVRTVRDAAADGRFGSLSVVNTYVPWWRDDEYYGPDRWQGTTELDGGGALMNQSIHGIDAVQWLAGSTMELDRETNPVEEVFAYTAKRAHDEDLIEVEDTAVATLRFRNGALGQVLGATSMYPGSLKRIQIAGRDGTAEVEEDELVTWSFRDEREDDDAVRERFGAETEGGGGAADPMSIDYSNHRRNIAAFLESLEGDEQYVLDGAEARKAVEIIEAIYESADEGRPVGIAER